MKKLLFLLLVTTTCATLKPQIARAQAPQYVLDKTIALPGDGGYDYSYIDQTNQKLYVSHGTAVQVIDLKTEKLVGTIDQMKGVHGIAIVNKLNRGFISDGKDNSVVAFDIKTLKIIKTIPITGKKPDCIIYDPYSNRIFAFNGDSNDASVVDPEKLEQSGTVKLNGAPEFAVSDGKGKIYNNLEDKSSLDVINTKTLTVEKNYSLAPCGGPTGIAIDKANNKLFTVCRENKGLSVVDIATGKVLQTLPIGGGVDAVVYDVKNKSIFVSNGDGTATIYKQESPDKYTLVQTLTTQNRAKTMAVNEATHKLYFSVPEFTNGTKNIVPNSFKVLVYKTK
jgi:DNA-binding beta-propeller fold protein YncE